MSEYLYIKRQRLRGLKRFHEAHQRFYSQAHGELMSGFKKTHWMWYIFPQPKGLGYSVKTQIYALSDREAKRYWQDPILRIHSLYCAQYVMYYYKLGKPLREMLGEVDALKFRSFLSLFAPLDAEIARMRDEIDGYRCD